MSNDPFGSAQQPRSSRATPLGPPGTRQQTGAISGAPGQGFSLEPGTSPVDGYVLESRLGRGGFGEVWQAIGPGGFRVALKFIRLEESAGAIELRSLELTKQIKHPNLLAQFGAWERDGYLIIAMELGNGTLYDRLKSELTNGRTGIPRPELLEYMREAAKAIDYLNSLNIQHRDIKPQNLLLVGTGVKVADFGLAKLLEHSVGAASGSMTPAYAAPEFLNGQATRWSDQYCLAVSYCQLRGNALPFAGNPAQVVAGHLTRPPDLAMLPPEERSIVARALAKDPQSRWPTCLAFIDALQSTGAAQYAGFISAVNPGYSAAVSTTSNIPQAQINTERQRGRAPSEQTPVRQVPKPAPTGTAALVLVGALLLGGLVGVGCLWWLSARQHEPTGTELVRNSSPAASQLATSANSTGLSQPFTSSSPVMVRSEIAKARTSREPQPSLLLPMLPPATLEAGGRLQLVVKIARMNCSGPVELKLTNLPYGVDASAKNISADASSGTLELTARSDAPATKRRITIEAVAGTTRASTPLVLEVVKSAVALQMRPLPTIEVMAGRSTSLVVRIDRGNCFGDIQLRWEGLPPGVGTSPSIIPAGSDLVTVLIQTDVGARWGRHALKLLADHPRKKAQVETTLVLLPFVPQDDQRLVLSSDGYRQLCVGFDSATRTTNLLLCECASGKPMGLPLHLNGTINLIRASRGGDRFAVSSGSGNQSSEIRVLNSVTGKVLGSTIRLNERVRDMVFVADGRQLISFTGNKLTCWEILSGKNLWKVTLETDLLRLSVSPDGNKFAGCCSQRKLHFWDARTGQEIFARSAHSENITSLTFSSDGKRIATTSLDKSACLFDTSTGQKLETLTHLGQVNWAAFSPDNLTLATACSDKSAQLWNVRNGTRLRTMSHDSAVFRVEFSPDGRYLQASESATHRQWEISTGKARGEPARRQSLIFVQPFSNDGKRAVVRLWDATARVWDVVRLVAVTPPLEHPDWVSMAAFSPCGRLLLTGCRNGSARVWDINTGRPLTPFRLHPSMVVRGQFSPDSGTVATVSHGTQTDVKIWDAHSGRTLATLPEYKATVNDLIFYPDGMRLALLGNDRTIGVWEVRTGRLMWKTTLPAAAFRVVLSPDSKELRIEGTSKHTRLDAETGKILADSSTPGSMIGD